MVRSGRPMLVAAWFTFVPDGTQQIVTQSLDTGFAESAEGAERFVKGTLPNGLAFARDGDILISNFGTGPA